VTSSNHHAFNREHINVYSFSVRFSEEIIEYFPHKKAAAEDVISAATFQQILDYKFSRG